jgi:chromosome segregation ATPase
MENSVSDSKAKEIVVADLTTDWCVEKEKQNDCSQIMQIAQMIQQKAKTLITERQHLHFLQLRLEYLNKEYDIQLEMNNKAKYDLLKQLRIVYGLEMRSIKRKEDIMVKRRRIEICIHKIRTLKEEKEAIKGKNNRYQELYSPHFAKINVCQRTLQRKIQAIRNEQERRDNEFELLMSERDRNLTQVNELQSEGKEIQSEIENMKKIELRDDEEIASLTSQVRATLAKRASLRHSILQAKERNDNAHEVVVKWEREYIA